MKKYRRRRNKGFERGPKSVLESVFAYKGSERRLESECESGSMDKGAERGYESGSREWAGGQGSVDRCLAGVPTTTPQKGS